MAASLRPPSFDGWRPEPETVARTLCPAAFNAAAELQKLGGAQVIHATAPSAKAMTALIDGLGPNGKMVVVGAYAA